MKKLISYGAMAVFVGVAATISGENEIHDGSSSGSGYIQTSKLIGRKVKSSEGNDIGVIKDVVIDLSNGCMAYTVLSTGGEGTGINSGGGKIVAVPWTVYSLTSNLSVLTVNVDREKIYNAPAFDYARMDEYARPDYTDNVYSYYGVSGGPRTAVAAGTDVTGTAGATASPGQVASPAAVPALTAPPTKKSSVHTHPSSAGNPSRASTGDRSQKAIGSARASGDGIRVVRNETGSSKTSEKSSSQSATSPNENKKSWRKDIEEISGRRPDATPESTDE